MKRKTPPGGNPAARKELPRRESGLERVGALPVLALRGRHGWTHLLAQGAADEPPDRLAFLAALPFFVATWANCGANTGLLGSLDLSDKRSSATTEG